MMMIVIITIVIIMIIIIIPIAVKCAFLPCLCAQLIVPFHEDSAVLVEENTDIPDYLPEEESPSQEQDKAVTRVGSVTDGMGWLSTAANFLTRSFYW